MKKLALVLSLTLLSVTAQGMDGRKYFERPLSCPLRFSSLSNLRDQVQMLISSLGTGCTKDGQQAINQLNANVTNLEGIYNSYNSYNSSTTDVHNSVQYAKNVGQVLGSINLITSNNACFYDIKSRGVLPVLADVVMSASQLGLLVPNVTGTLVAAGGYVAGSSLKIINELVKKKFNFNKPEERRAFIQLNCAFFDSRRMMEESGIFNPEAAELREEIVNTLRKERIELLKVQKEHEESIKKLDKALTDAINEIPSARDRNLDPLLNRKYDEITIALARRPVDYTEKLKQVTYLSERIDYLLTGTERLILEPKFEPSRQLLLASLQKIQVDLVPNAKAWVSNIDEHEMTVRGPLMAFIQPVNDALKKELTTIETELAENDQIASKIISRLRQKIKEGQDSSWGVALRLNSLEATIASLESRSSSSSLFSESDEGTSNAVDILDFYRNLQTSILGREGKDYLKNAIKTGHNMKSGLEHQLSLMRMASSPREKCSAAEKTRFAWSQYRYKTQEIHDFVVTNLDLYRSSFRIGKERLKRSTLFVLHQIQSVETFMTGQTPIQGSAGFLMDDVSKKLKFVEPLLHNSGCF